MKGTYLRQTTTGRCFAWTEKKAERGDMVPWTGPLPWETQEAPATKETPGSNEGAAAASGSAIDDVDTTGGMTRADIIKAAVKATPEDQYTKATNQKPATPKVAYIQEVTGIEDVSAAEILEAMKQEG